MVTPAEKDEVIEPGRAAGGPVAHVVGVAVATAAPGEAAPVVPGRHRPADGGRDGPGLAGNVECGAVRAVAHDDGGGIARHAANRLRGNVETIRIFQRRLSGSGVVLQHFLVNVDDDLIPVADSSAIEVGSQGAFG